MRILSTKMTKGLFICTTCNGIFRNQVSLNNHVKCNHQQSVMVKFRNGNVVKIKRSDDNAFKCKCGKSFQYPDSLRRHGKICNDELAESEEEEEERILMD